jgi:hypothetical protein
MINTLTTFVKDNLWSCIGILSAYVIFGYLCFQMSDENGRKNDDYYIDYEGDVIFL